MDSSMYFVVGRSTACTQRDFYVRIGEMVPVFKTSET